MTTNKKPKDRVLSPLEIRRIAEHQGRLHGPNAAALVACSGLAMLTLLDLSLVRVSDLVSESGQLYIETTVPAEYSPADREKLVVIPDNSYLQQALGTVISWRQSEHIGLSGIGTYSQLGLLASVSLMQLVLSARETVIAEVISMAAFPLGMLLIYETYDEWSRNKSC